MNYKYILNLGFALIILSCSSFRKTSSSDCSGSRFKAVDMTPYYSALGVIIPKDYANVNTLLGIPDSARFTPNLKEIQKAEEILFDEYENDFRNISRINDPYFKTKNARNYLKNFPRQYLGYLNKDGNKIILINLLHRNNSELPKKQRLCWNNNFVQVINEAGFGTSSYPVNLKFGILE